MPNKINVDLVLRFLGDMFPDDCVSFKQIMTFCDTKKKINVLYTEIERSAIITGLIKVTGDSFSVS